MVFNLGAGCVRLDRLNAFLGTRLRLVTLACGDDLAVGALGVVGHHASNDAEQVLTFLSD